METWSVHTLYKKSLSVLGEEKAKNIKLYAQHLINAGLPVIFSLRHLSYITNVEYSLLRNTVLRKRESSNYEVYPIRKKSGGLRFIHAVRTELMKVQQFINTELLQKIKPHHASFAFHADGGIKKCAIKHCNARWLFKFDLKNFFYDVNEIDVYKIFISLGYRKLLSFELARLCTTIHFPKKFINLLIHKVTNCDYPYPEYNEKIGVLPQGAPTSPMLANLAAINIDEALLNYSQKFGFVYTRYADDITISARDIPSNLSIDTIHNQIVKIIFDQGFKVNTKKTSIARPGSRKVVLGLLVDGELPRISKKTYKRIDRLLYASEKYGIEKTAKNEKFRSAFGFMNHLTGLIAYVKDVDTERWEHFQNRMVSLNPLKLSK